MAKFNVVQKQRRAQIAQMKRAAHGDPLIKKLKIKQQPSYVSRQTQAQVDEEKSQSMEEKVAVQMGLTNMEDIEMAVAEGPKKGYKISTKFRVKKSVRLRELRSKGKKKGNSSKLNAAALGDAMVE